MTALKAFALLGLLSQFAFAGKVKLQLVRGTHGFKLGDELAPAGTASIGSTAQMTPPISYHGGPVLTTPNIYLIFYGAWSAAPDNVNGGKQIAIDFVKNLGGSSWMSIVNDPTDVLPAYTGPGGIETTNLLGPVTNADIGWATNAGSLRPRRQTSLSMNDVYNLVQYYISTTTSKIKDPNGIYFIISSSTVTQTNGGQNSMCKQYCGWHTASSGLRFGWVGNPTACLNGCAPQSISPNGNAGVDAIVNLLAHEIIEATTDPDQNGWFDSAGYENADKCAWTFGGAQYKVANLASANVHLGSRDYLIQRNLGLDNRCYVDGVNKVQ